MPESSQSSQTSEAEVKDKFKWALDPHSLLTGESFWSMISHQYFPTIYTYMCSQDKTQGLLPQLVPETDKYSEESITSKDRRTLISNSVKSAIEHLTKPDQPPDLDFDALESQLHLQIEQVSKENQNHLQELEMKLYNIADSDFEFTKESEFMKNIMNEYISKHKQSGNTLHGIKCDKFYWDCELVRRYFDMLGWPSGTCLEQDRPTDQPIQQLTFTNIPQHLQNKNKVFVEEVFDDRCFICGYDDYEEANKILYCEECDIGIHQNCYGIINVDVKYIDFKCWTCQAFVCKENAMGVVCRICGKNGGALWPTNLSEESYQKLLKQNLLAPSSIQSFIRQKISNITIKGAVKLEQKHISKHQIISSKHKKKEKVKNVAYNKKLADFNKNFK